MKKVDLTFSFAQANLWSIPVMVGVEALIAVPFALLWGWPALFAGARAAFGNLLIFVAVLGAGIFVHEGLHALGWLLAGRVARRDIAFGLKSLTPYAHCKVPMRARAYRIGGALPGVALGVLPALIGIFTGAGWLAAWGALFAMTAAGDWMILWLLRRTPADALVSDHPTMAGCEVWLEE